MPWVLSDVDRHKKGLTDAQKERWVAIANSVRQDCIDDGGDAEECDARAIRIANAKCKGGTSEMGGFNQTTDVLEVLGFMDGDVLTWWDALSEQNREAAQSAKDARARRYGISSIEGKNVTKPSQWSSVPDSEFGDPVNYAYPCPNAEQALTALRYFNQSDARSSGGYSEADWNKVGGRLARIISSKTGTRYQYSGGKLAQAGQQEAQESLMLFDIFGSPATTFGELLGRQKEDAISQQLESLSGMFPRLVSNVLFSKGLAEERAVFIRALCEEFAGLADGVLGIQRDAVANGNTPTQELQEVALAESLEDAEGISVLTLLDEADLGDGGRRAPLIMEVALIQPGWGNQKRNNYYPADVLKRDATVFEGVEMFITNHIAEEQTERSKVSIIERVTRFLNDGTPVGRVKVFDPDFAEKTRNRADANELATLHCSINGWGQTKEGEIEGKKGNIVEKLTRMESVDWVSRAGAGGHALNIMESEDEVEENTEDGMEEEQQNQVLASEDVERILTNSALPESRKTRLRESQWESEAVLQEAVDFEVNYIKDITRAGSPVDVGDSSPGSSQTQGQSLRERELAVVKKYLPNWERRGD